MRRRKRKRRDGRLRGKAASAGSSGGDAEARNFNLKNTSAGRKHLAQERKDMGGSVGEVEFQTRDSYARKLAMRRKLKVRQLASAIDQEEASLKSFTYGVQNITDVESSHVRSREDMRKRKEKGVLRGPARPATEVYPWLYEDELDRKDEYKYARPSTKDMVDECSPRCSFHCHTRTLLSLYYKLALAHIESDTEASWTEAVRVLRDISERLDAERDALGGRIMLLRCLLELGEVGQAREVCDREDSAAKDTNDTPSSDVLWSRAMIDYVSWTVGNQEGGKARSSASLRKAHSSNPYISFALAHLDDFAAYVDPEAMETFIEPAREEMLDEFVSKKEDDDAHPSDFLYEPRMFGTCCAGASARGSLARRQRTLYTLLVSGCRQRAPLSGYKVHLICRRVLICPLLARTSTSMPSPNPSMTHT